MVTNYIISSKSFYEVENKNENRTTKEVDDMEIFGSFSNLLRFDVEPLHTND